MAHHWSLEMILIREQTKEKENLGEKIKIGTNN